MPADLTALRTSSRDLGRGWFRAEVAGREVDWCAPAEWTGEAVVLSLHGHDETMLADRPAWSELISRGRLAVVAPHGSKSWWTDQTGAGFDSVSPQEWLTTSVLPWVAQHFEVAPPKVGLLGFGMGGQGVLRLSYRDASRFPVVVACSPAIDFWKFIGAGLPLDELYSDQEAARQASVLLEIHPLNWPKHQMLFSNPLDSVWHDGADRLAMKLSSSGVMHDRNFDTCGSGSPWDYFDRIAEEAWEYLDRKLLRSV